MLPKDETQHQAELRQAFLKHLPRRIELLQKRAHRLASGAWDINLLGVLCQETQTLTGATGRYGLIEANERLYQLELLLTDLLCDSSVPEPATKLRLTDLSQQLISGNAEPPRSAPAIATDFVQEPPVSVLPYLNRLIVPAEYWRRFSTREMALLDAQHPLGSSTPPASLQLKSANEREARFDSFDSDALTLELGPVSSGIGPGYEDPFALPPEPVPAPPAPAPAPAPSPLVAPRTEAWPGTPVPGAMVLEPVAPPASKPQVDEWSAVAVSSAPASSAESTAPAPAEVATGLPRTRRGIVLAEPGPFAREVSTRLIGLGLSVERIDNIEELKEHLSAVTSDLVVIESTFASDLEQFGEFIRRYRARTPQKLHLCAVLPDNDLQMRLRAMRAGVDLVLPMPVTAAEVAQRGHELALGEQAAHYRIMIVEDDRSQALFAESLLRKAGMETCAVTDALETISTLERFRPDLVLMDLYMPGIDGMELTAIIRERQEFISIPIVFLSGEQDSDKHFEALNAGGDDFLAKPIRPKHLISAVTNRARRARALSQRRSATPRDAESGLFERVFVLDKLGELFGQDELQTSVAFVELDSGAQLREHHGVAGLDALIVQMSAAIVSSLREGEVACRYGDASVLVLAPNRAPAALAEAAELWRKQISAGLYELSGKVVPLQISVGIAALAPNMGDAAALINAAERALLQARQPSSRDRVRIFTAEAPRSGDEHLLELLRRAIKLEDFQLLFQPIVALSNSGQEQYEVLLRLRDDNGKLINSAQFMPLAQTHKLAADIDRFLLSRCLSIIDERKRQGRSLRLFVHQSLGSLEDASRAAWLKQMLETRKLPPDSLVLMYTFGDIMPQLRAVIPYFQSMRQMGVRLSLDQFESSLTALQLLGYLPAHYLRLASKYVGSQGVSGGEELKALVGAAHDGGRQIIANRVENAQTAAALWTLGVDLIQGNFVQQPGAELGFDFNASAL